MSGTLRIIFALVALCAFKAIGETTTTPAVPVRGLAFELKPELIEPGERARLTVALPLASVGLSDVTEETELPALRDDLLLEAKDIQVLDRDFRRERDHLIWTFDVSAHKDGKYNLPPLEVRFGPHTFSTESVALTVKSKRPPGDEALRPDFGSMGSPWHWEYWLGALVVFVLGYVAWIKSNHRRRLIARVVTRWWHHFIRYWEEPAAESVLRFELNACRRSLDAGESPAAALDRASRAVRNYLAHRRESAANAWTTEELQQHGALRSAELEAAFIAGDATKFAPGELEAHATARRMIDAATSALTGPRRELLARGNAYLRSTRRWLRARFPFLRGGSR